METSGQRSTVGGWKTSPWAWGGLFVLAALFFAIGLYALVDRREEWVWDVVKAFGAAVIALSVGIDWRRRGRRTG